METKARVRREDKIAVMFSSDMRRRLNVLAEGFGMPPSTLCAFAVATWVQQQERGLDLTRQAITQIADKAGEMLTDEEALQVAIGSAVSLARAQDKQGILPLEQEQGH